ncbi:hypothetical protein ACA366_22580, partial [Klebsiella pneumoniae]
MTRLPESSSWEEEIELISRSERVSGGLDGVANRPLKSLANRTRYLKGKADKSDDLIAEKVSAVKTFTEGATLESPREEILYGIYRLVWTGEFPKVVPVSSSPETTGGIGAGAWAYTSDAQFRHDLSAADGPKHIGRCEDVKTLRKTEPTQRTQLIRTISYSTGLAAELPCGGGDYEYDPGDTSSPDDGILTIVTSNGARWKKILNDLALTCADAGVFPSGDDDTDALNALFTVVASFWWTRGRFRLDMMGLKFRSSKGNTVEFDPNRIELCNFYINNVYYTSTTPFAIVCARSTLPFQDGVNRVQGNVENLKIEDSTRHTTSPVTALYLVSDVNGASSSVVFNNLVAHGSKNGIAYGSHCYLTTFNGGSVSAGNNNVDAVTAGLETSLVDMGENFRFNGMTFMGTRIFNWGTLGAEFNFTDVSMDFVALGVNNASGFVLDVKGGHAEFNNNYERWFSSSKPAYVSFKPAWVVCDGTNATTDHMFYDDTGANQLSVDSDIT